MFVCNKFPRVMKFSHKPLKLSSFSNQIKLNQFSNPSIFRNFGLFSPFSKLGLFGNQNLQIPSFSNHNITFFKTFSLNSFSTETQAQVSSSTPIQVKSEQITDYGTLIVTDRCSEMIRKLIQQEWVKNKEDAKLRVFVKGGGCSGLEYDFEITAEPLTEDDIVFEKNGACVVIDKESLKHLNGSKVDWKDQLIRSSFTINDNPNATQACGCGHSFSSKLL